MKRLTKAYNYGYGSRFEPSNLSLKFKALLFQSNGVLLSNRQIVVKERELHVLFLDCFLLFLLLCVDGVLVIFYKFFDTLVS